MPFHLHLHLISDNDPELHELAESEKETCLAAIQDLKQKVRCEILSLTCQSPLLNKLPLLIVIQSLQSQIFF